MSSKSPQRDHEWVVVAFQQAKASAPSDELIELILLEANTTKDEPPYNQFYDDELQKAFAHLYRILLNRVAYWRRTLKSFEHQTYLTVEDDREELRMLIRDAEIAMNLPAFYHRMSARNVQGKDNVRGEGPEVRKRAELIGLIQAAGYEPAEAMRVVLYLIPAGHLANPKDALRQAIKRRKRKVRK